MTRAAARHAIWSIVIALVGATALGLAGGCGASGSGKTGGAAGTGAGVADASAGSGAAGTSAGAAGGASAGAAGQSAGAAGQSVGGAGGANAIGGSGGGAGSGGSGGSTAGAGGGAAGASAGAAGTVGGTLTSGTGGGLFVMCDDHADFNGRGLCSPTGKYGAVVATQTRSAAGTLTTLTASFGASKPASDPGCTQEAAGMSCTAVTCPGGLGKGPGGPEAGAITARSNGGAIVTRPDATGAYDVAGLASALWTQPGAALTFAAAGGAVPMFSETFCGPAAATITKPAAAPGAALTIDRATDLPVAWTGGAVGDLEIVLREEGGAVGSSVEVRCFFTGSAGQGTVPKAALAKMSAGMHAVASYIWVRKISLPQGTCVELTGVNTNASAAGGVPWYGAATFQ